MLSNALIIAYPFGPLASHLAMPPAGSARQLRAVGSAPTRSYGNFGNCVKSGARFSLNASRPSFASSVV